MAAVDGLVSGLNTNTIITQLMQLERQPQARLQTQKELAQKSIDAYRGINKLLLSVETAAQALATGTGWGTGWGAAKATSSDPARVAVTARPGAAAMNLSFTVSRLAAAGSSASTGTVASPVDLVVPPGTTLTLTKGTTTTSVPTGTGSLADLVKAVNDAQAGITATAVQVQPDQYKLVLTSTTTGAASSLTLDDGAGGNPFTAASFGSVAQVVAGADAELQVGGAAGYTVTRPSNTISDLVTGVTLTLLKADPAAPVTLDVASDPAATADAVAKLVEQVNTTLSDLRKLTGYDTATKKGGLLSGDGLMRSLTQRLLSAVSAGGPTAGTSALGVSVSREGTVTFDRTKVVAAYEKDPIGTRAALGGTKDAPGLAERFRTLASDATRSASSADGVGQITSAVRSREDRIRGLTSQIASWDNRLQLRETTLRSKFAALEVVLGKNQQQSAWLAGQLAGLPKYGG